MISASVSRPTITNTPPPTSVSFAIGGLGLVRAVLFNVCVWTARRLTHRQPAMRLCPVRELQFGLRRWGYLASFHTHSRKSIRRSGRWPGHRLQSSRSKSGRFAQTCKPIYADSTPVKYPTVSVSARAAVSRSRKRVAAQNVTQPTVTGGIRSDLLPGCKRHRERRLIAAFQIRLHRNHRTQ